MTHPGNLLRPAGPDGLRTSAYHAPPREARRGGVLVLSDRSGVTSEIRALCDDFAGGGWECLAPSFSEPAGVADLVIAIAALAPPVCVLGFGFGGAAAYLAACRCEGVSAAAAFYPQDIMPLIHETLRTGIALHLGRTDPLMSPEDIEAIALAQPAAILWLYDAGRGFAAPNSAYPDAARLSLLRVRQQFHRAVLGGKADGP